MFDRDAFRNALGTFVTGVTIVTARDGAGNPAGLTANSFNSVSLDPPMVLWSLSLASGSLPVFREAESWAVHVLAADQQDMSNRFATPGADKFAGLDLADGPEGAPLIEGCAARFGCSARFEYEGGDHAIFLGEVVDFADSEAEPLIYHGGRYGRVMQPGGGTAAGPEERQLYEELVASGHVEEIDGELVLTEHGRSEMALLAALDRR